MHDADHPLTTLDLLETQREARGEAPALLALDRPALTYAGLNPIIDEAGSVLAALGFARGHRIAVALPDGPDAALAVLATMTWTACAPLDPRMGFAACRELLAAARIDAVLTADGEESPVARAAIDAGVPLLGIASAGGRGAGLPTWRRGTARAGLARVRPRPEDIALVLHTSGTTGRPKIVPVTHAGLLGGLHAQPFRPDDRCLAVSPLHTLSGLGMCLLGPLTFGASTVLTPGFDASRFFGWLDAFRVTFFSASPTVHAAIIDAMRAAAPPLPGSLRFVRSSSNAMTAAMQQELEALLRVPVIQGYGATECCLIAQDAMPPGQRRPGSVGKAAGSEIMILASDGSAAPPGVDGEILVRGPAVMRGYENDPEANRAAFRDGWFRTGDLGRLDDDGYLFVTGRIKEIINRGGLKVAPAEVDAVFAGHPGVLEAATVGVAHPSLGEDVVTAVVLRHGAATTTEALGNYARQRLAPAKVPTSVVIVEAIPRTALGKVRRAELAAALERARSVEFIAPRDPEEALVAGAFAAALGVPQVGARDNFFDIGGDSLRAVDVLARLHTRSGVEMDSRALFEAPTVEALARRLHSGSSVPGTTAAVAPRAVTKAPRAAAAPQYSADASFGQEQMWLLDQILPDRSVYNETWVDRLTGPLDAGVLARALGALVARHDALRTRFAAVDGVLRQMIMPAGPLELPVDDFASLPPAERELAAREFALRTIAQPFDLERGPPLRVRLLRLAPDEHWLAVAVHHIVFDRWSSAIFMRELSELYAALARDETPSLPALRQRYADYARWQREHLTPATLERLLAFWQGTLEGLPELSLPTDRPRPPVASFRGAQVDFEIDAELTAGLRALARREKATLFMTLLAAYQVLLHRYTGQDDFAVGTPIAGRTREDAHPLIGFFVNMLVMRCDLRGDPSFTEHLARVRAGTLDVYAHAELPLEKLVERLAPSRDLARNPLYQVSLRFGNTPNPELRLPGISVRRISGMRTRTAKFDLAFAVHERDARLTVRAEYATDLFDAPTIERMAGHFQTLLRGIVDDPARPVSRLPLLTLAERQRTLVEWNDTAMPLPEGATIASLFAEQVARDPQATAVVRGRRRLSYAELDSSANRLANRLRALGAGPETAVAVMMPRTVEWTIAMLGIMKAGAAYVPLDPELPAERLDFLLGDTHARALVLQRPLSDAKLGYDGATVCLDDSDAALAAMPDTAPQGTGDPRTLAYVIHTSGSTGAPKGVAIEHRALVNHLRAAQRVFSPGPSDCVLQTASIGFDQSIWQVLFPLLAGGRVALPESDALQGGDELAAEIRRHGVTILRIVPTILAALVDGHGLRDCPSLRTVIVAGEVLDRRLADTFAAQCGADLVNAYGPTETTFVSLLHRVCRDAAAGPIPIGCPLGNVRAYVLDRHDQPVPVGVPGELCIAGASVGRGYWNRPELTAAAFVPDPFGVGDDARMYRTGDIVRQLAGGEFDFLGRRDGQVKLHGVRIELGEIDAALASHPAVAACTSTLWTDADGAPRLAAYYVARGSTHASPSQLRAHLARKLPAAMVPRLYQRLDALPLTPSGKVDRRALPLPQPGALNAATGDDRVAPRDPVEASIAAVWEELLGTNRIDVHQNFFDAGGHSLLAMRLIARVEQIEGIRLRVRDFFEAPDIASLARSVARARAAPASPLGAIARERRQHTRVE
jgi:amino acid adenylation domain-containing protein